MEHSPQDSERTLTRDKRLRITVEPVFLLYMCGVAVQSVVIQNLFLDKACQVNFGFNSTQCSSFNGSLSALDVDAVQDYVSNLNIYATLIENIPCIFFTLFLGPWSDRHGRKVPMMLPLIGHLFSVLVYTINLFHKTWPAEYILLASVPLGLSGSQVAFFMSLYSYISDITTAESRTSRIAVLNVFGLSALPIAMLSSGYIFKYGGYFAIWTTSFTVVLLALVYLVFCVKDSRGKVPSVAKNRPTYGSIQADEVEVPEQGSCMSHLLDVENVKDCFRATFKKREGFTRCRIVILLLSMSVYVLSQGTSSIGYLYTRKIFNWDQPHYTIFSAVTQAVASFGTLVGVPFLSYCLKLHDCLLGLIGVVCFISANLFFALASSEFMMYCGGFCLVFVGAVAVVIRSMLSKSVPGHDLSKVFSILASMESIVPLLSSPLFNIVYEATIETFPGCGYLVAAGLQATLIVSLISLLVLSRIDSNNENVLLVEDSGEENQVTG